MFLIDLTHPDLSMLAGHLKMGGKDPRGHTINANSRYITLNDQPWLPVMGEFHFSRYPQAGWEQELRKMKAGGINIAASYIFWNHHEEIEGVFDWTDNRNLRHFTEMCAKVGLYCYPRIGPWAHGEARNGGFPDWLLEKCAPEIRRDAPLYLSYVRRWYKEIARQLGGLLWKDGGPAIGIQLENELTNQPGHILTLKNLALQAGLDVPLYTMTGWGPAEVPADEVIPVFGGYPDAFWDRQVSDWARECRKHYFFNALRDDNTIGNDLGKRQGLGDLFHLQRYPYGTCETGGGMQVSYHRRPVIQGDDIPALAFMKIGNGSNLQGYYMYHGGSHPIGQLSTLQESQETHYPNDLPVINYDFQAPLGEYGQVRPSYHALRMLHLFLADYGSRLAPMPMQQPQHIPHDLEDSRTLRWAVRTDGQAGFLFLNNYQRVENLPEHANVQFELHFQAETLTIPSQPVQVPSGLFGIWPLNLDLNGACLKYATAQPICCLEQGNDAPLYVFFALPGIPAEFAWDASRVKAIRAPGQVTRAGDRWLVKNLKPGTDCLMRLETTQGSPVAVLLLDALQARQLWKADLWGRQRIFLAPDSLLFEQDTLQIRTRTPEAISFAVFPPVEGSLAADGRGLTCAADGIFTRYTLPLHTKSAQVQAQKIKSAAPARPVKIGAAGNVAQAPEEAAFEDAEVWQIRFPEDILDGVQEVYLRVDYVGDVARAYLGERLIADDFYTGNTWEIGLGRFAPELFQYPLTLRFLPLRKDAPIYLPPDRWPNFGSAQEIIQVRSIGVQMEYKVNINCSH
jgi:beta-galactosidase